MIGIGIHLPCLDAKLLFTKTEIQEGCGHREELTDGIWILQWTIISVICIIYLTPVDIASQDPLSSSHNIASSLI
jgi:hypothetical protein